MNYVFSLDQLLTIPASDKRREVEPGQRPRVIAPLLCVDGTQLSVQASTDHYCLPLSDEGPWTHVEVKVDAVPATWASYRDTELSNIYKCVPAELVREFVAAHGGEAAR